MAYTIEKSTSTCQSCRRPRMSIHGNYVEQEPIVYDVLISRMLIHICAECAGWIADDLKAQESARGKQ